MVQREGGGDINEIKGESKRMKGKVESGNQKQGSNVVPPVSGSRFGIESGRAMSDRSVSSGMLFSQMDDMTSVLIDVVVKRRRRRRDDTMTTSQSPPPADLAIPRYD